MERHLQLDRSRAGLGSSNKRGVPDGVPGHHLVLCSCHHQQRDVLVHGCDAVGSGAVAAESAVVVVAVAVVVFGDGAAVVATDDGVAGEDDVTAADCDGDDDADEGRYWHCCILLRDY